MREHDVLSGLPSGLSNKEIADNLSLSEVTVKHHIKSLRGKLGARNRVHAVCRANELDIIEAQRIRRWGLVGRRRGGHISWQSAVLAIIH